MSDEDKTRPSSPAYKSPTAQLDGLSGRELIIALKKMNTGQKKLLALKGNAAIRKILQRDPNFEIQLAVVNSSKTTESEVEQLAGLPSTAEIVLKTIFSNTRWTKSYRIKHRLAKNPKTPIGIANRCLRLLTTHDIKKISQDPHIRKTIAQTAKQLLKSRK